MPSDDTQTREALILGPGEGRSYPMGRIQAIFKADGSETDFKYSISEWWLEPKTQGPGVHSHLKEDTFFVIAGVMSFFIADKWINAGAGSFVLIPGGVDHDFENRGSIRAGVLNLSFPGGFEANMPDIAQWFKENPPQDTSA